MTKTIVSLFFSCLTLVLISCSGDECLEDTRVNMRVSFYNYEDKTKSSPESVTLYGIDNEEAIKVTSPALFPLKNSDTETGFIITINGTTDTIWFLHSNSLHFISKECGYTMYHTIDTVYFSTNEIDSIFLINKYITLRKTEHVEIFY